MINSRTFSLAIFCIFGELFMVTSGEGSHVVINIDDPVIGGTQHPTQNRKKTSSYTSGNGTNPFADANSQPTGWSNIEFESLPSSELRKSHFPPFPWADQQAQQSSQSQASFIDIDLNGNKNQVHEAQSWETFLPPVPLHSPHAQKGNQHQLLQGSLPTSTMRQEFLEFQKEKQSERYAFGWERCHCGQYLLRDMRPIKYGDWNLRVWPLPLGSGTTSRVFHAHPMPGLKDFAGNPIGHCVAIKSVLLRKAGILVENEMRNEIKILKEFAKIKAERVIRLFAFQDLDAKKQLLFLMELGENNLEMEMHELALAVSWRDPNIDDKKIEQKIEEIIMQILEAIKEMHKLVMHLDLKPANMIYVKVPMPTNGRVGGGGFKRVLKIIDFGGSEFIPKEVDQMEKKRGNSCKMRTTNWRTHFYASPEQENICKMTRQYTFSIKCDIWAFGIMLLEMLLAAPMFKELKLTYDEMVENMAKIYRDSDYRAVIPSVYRDIAEMARNNFPRFFDILTATLNRVPFDRPTSRGLISYLSQECHLKMGRQVDSFVQDQLFPTMTPGGIRNLQKLMDILENSGRKGMERLEAFLTGKYLPNQLGAADNSWASGAANWANKIKRVVMARKKREIAKGNDSQEMGKICDTETTGNPMAINSNELHNSVANLKSALGAIKEQKRVDDEAKANGKSKK